MANPQLERGHTRIANEILDCIMQLPLNGTQFRLVMAVWRHTYGFQRKEHVLSTSYLGKKIGAHKNQVKREIAVLIAMRILSAKTGPRNTRIIGFNKNYEEWLRDPEEGEKAAAPKKEGKPVSKKPKKYDEDNTYYKMAAHFWKLVTAVAKDAGVEHLTRKANLQSWADDFRKLVELDGVDDKKLISDVMRWTTSHTFWRTNVLSAKKFREKFAELAIKMKAEEQGQQQKKHPSHYQTDNRDYEIALNKWIAQGGDPDEFDYGQ
ncbi:replication protein [Halalkalibacter oceani]|uniref:replication protein n=1 Tax=Halalkalibacter oceani TaxID=1653776 RepID=UPI003398FB04